MVKNNSRYIYIYYLRPIESGVFRLGEKYKKGNDKFREVILCAICTYHLYYWCELEFWTQMSENCAINLFNII
jgi:hypothetical protein